MTGMGVPDAGDPVGEGAVFQPVTDLGTDRAPARTLAGPRLFPYFSSNYKQYANIAHDSVGERVFQPLMRQGKAVAMKVDRHFRVQLPLLNAPFPTAVEDIGGDGAGGRRRLRRCGMR